MQVAIIADPIVVKIDTGHTGIYDTPGTYSRGIHGMNLFSYLKADTQAINSRWIKRERASNCQIRRGI
ncbi:MAG TPA: hypothetical protein DIT99_06825 [Candidatus Latescibacteria bacterium]|nr:hypothetical protein [Candidatus Latescibacterota bacterium]